MSRRTICAILAAVVTVCFAVTLLAAVHGLAAAARSGGTVPTGLLMLSLVTGLCALMIWRGVRDMD